MYIYIYIYECMNYMQIYVYIYMYVYIYICKCRCKNIDTNREATLMSMLMIITSAATIPFLPLLRLFHRIERRGRTPEARKAEIP